MTIILYRKKYTPMLRFLFLAVLYISLPLAHADEIKPDIMCTLAARFADLKDYPFDAHYREIDGKRVHKSRGQDQAPDRGW